MTTTGMASRNNEAAKQSTQRQSVAAGAEPGVLTNG